MESDALSIISDGLAAVTEGCRLPVLCSTCTHHLEDNWEGESHETTCLFFASAFHTQVRMKNSEDWPKAEVISIRQASLIHSKKCLNDQAKSYDRFR